MSGNFVDAFFASAKEFADRRAIEVSCGQSVTYQELAEKIHKLSETYVRRKTSFIPLQRPRSIDYVAHLIAIWEAGKIALIMDPVWPDERSAQILRNTEAASLAPETAYIIYTSGSSGEPKGALLPLSGLCLVLDAQIEAFALTPESRFYWMHGVAFDASLSDIGCALLSGGTLCIDTEIDHSNLPAAWARMHISHVDLPPALLPLIDPADASTVMKTIIVGGQVCDASSIRSWSQACRVVNVYGPTEATICTSFSICDGNWSRNLIGQPIPGITYQIDDETGELLITSEGVALGYVNNPKLTKQRFTTESDGRRTFHTRDCVRMHSDGKIEFIGRMDRQTKVHGRLVHLEEIESAIRQFPAIKNTIVLQLDDDSLAACLSGHMIIVSDVINHIAKTLPKWMIPSRWKCFDSLPVSSNGKTDVQAVARMFHESTDTTETCNFSPTETKIAEIFTEALDGHCPGIDAAIQQSGGDSLALIRILSISERRGIQLSIDALESFPTIRSLATALDLGRDLEDGRSTAFLRESIKPLLSERLITRMSGRSPRRILLTGGTGFYGSAILGELLSRADVEVLCLVRGGSSERLKAALAKHGLAGNTNLTVVDGNIEKPDFDLPPAVAKTIDTVIHVAADVSLAKSYDSLFNSNVLGTKHVLDFCRKNEIRNIHYVSTLSVFVDALPLPKLCKEGDNLDDTQKIFGGYAQSKWSAEILVREICGNEGVSIYRPGLLTANSKTGYSPPTDWFDDFLTTHHFSKDNTHFDRFTCDFTPVDIAATQTVAIILKQVPGTFHIANRTPMHYRELAELQKNRQASNPSGLKMSTGNSPLRIFKTTNTRFSFDNTDQLL